MVTELGIYVSSSVLENTEVVAQIRDFLEQKPQSNASFGLEKTVIGKN